LNKLIRLNKQMSIVWIWFGFVTVMFGLSISVYAIHDILINLDSYVNIHVKLNSNINENINLINMFSKSMKDNILNLKISNYISIIAIISLMGLTMLKFHFNKNVHNIFIWLLILILIITLAFSAYTYNELYTNINSYVNMYLNQK
jgi:sterol desaturase/sphingolipid hydroxylase (fatty acid hydroxylase superfamily)